jgi:UrcA family protein
MDISLNKAARSTSLIAVAAIAIFAGIAQASPSAPQITVRYENSTDTQQLYSRLQSAAAAVCRQHEGRELRNLSETRACYNDALGNAVAKVGNGALTSLHHANSDMRLAQRETNRQHS